MGMKPLLRLLMTLVLTLATATASEAVELRGRSSTQALSFMDFYKGRQVEIAEYLRFSLTGIDNAGKLAFTGYGRGTQDLNNGEGFNGRLYFLYGDYRDLSLTSPKIDLKDVSEPVLVFWTRVELEDTWDFLYVEGSGDNGGHETWALVLEASRLDEIVEQAAKAVEYLRKALGSELVPLT